LQKPLFVDKSKNFLIRSQRKSKDLFIHYLQIFRPESGKKGDANMVKKIGKWIFLAAVAVLLIVQPVFAQNRIIDLGTLGGTWAGANKINNHGQVIGASLTAAGEWHGFLWTAEGGMIDLGTLGGSESDALGINDQGQVVGYSQTASGDYHAFLWTAEGGMVDLGTFGNGTYSEADAINNLGQVVGIRTTIPGDPLDDPAVAYSAHAFLWTAARGMVDLGTLGGSFSYAGAINNSGQVVGDSLTAAGEDHAFLWTVARGMVDLGTLGGTYSFAYAINNQGQIVGNAETASGEDHAFLWTAARGMVDLGTLGGSYSYGYAINNLGQVVGFSYTASGEEHGFFWTAAGGMVDLGTLGGTASGALAINKVGQIVGFSTTASGEEHAVLWELAPPALSSFAIFAMNSVRFSHGVQVNSGNIGVRDKNSRPWHTAKAEVMIGNRAYLKDKVAIYGDSVMIFSGASVYDVYYNELQNMGKIRGDKYTPLELPLDVALPAFPTPHPGTKDYVVPKYKILILEPGSYGKIEVELKATLILTGGTYHVENLVVGSIQSKVLFRGPTELIIKNYLRSGVNAFIGPEKGADISAKDIRIYVKGIHGKTGKCDANHQAAVIGEHNTVTANIYVPDGTLRIEQDSAVKGAFIAKDVEIGEDAQVTLDSAF
jgi:probable HAF family extracellular repeat protein